MLVHQYNIYTDYMYTQGPFLPNIYIYIYIYYILNISY